VRWERGEVLFVGLHVVGSIDNLLYDAAGKRLDNFTRVETFGAADVHWLRATVDARNPNVFRFEQRIVRSNLEQH
jgi:hypothetical protein